MALFIFNITNDIVKQYGISALCHHMGWSWMINPENDNLVISDGHKRVHVIEGARRIDFSPTLFGIIRDSFDYLWRMGALNGVNGIWLDSEVYITVDDL